MSEIINITFQRIDHLPNSTSHSKSIGESTAILVTLREG